MQLEFFSVENLQAPSVEQLESLALAAIGKLLDAGHPASLGFSGGKDSSVVSNLLMTAATLAVKRGLHPLIVVTSSDTLVENPEISLHFRTELRKMIEYGKANGFKVITKVALPNLASTFQMKVLSGRGLPSYAGTSSDCSVDLKVSSQIRERKSIFKALQSKGYSEPCTLLGSRFSEGQKRSAGMKARNDSADSPVRNKDGDLVMCPIAHWDEESVYEYLGLASSGIIASYSDFEETKRIYSNSMATSCMVVADAIFEGGKRQRIGKCGARTGCWTCLQAEDKSLANMVKFDDRYAYARGLLRLNNFMRNIRWDWSRRHWVGRTIRAGYVAIEPDTFHPDTIRELTRYMLQLDHDERVRAERAGARPMFQILPIDMLIAIDAIQSLNGVAKPFACVADYWAINEEGVRYDIPDIEEVPKTPPPTARFYLVESELEQGEWDKASRDRPFDGIRDAYVEALTERSGCNAELRELDYGLKTWDAETEKTFTVDAESAGLIFEFEFERLVQMHKQGFAAGGVVSAYLWYRQYGVLNLSHGMVREHDEFARRTQWKDRNGMTLSYDVADLQARSVEFKDLPPHAAKAWRHKATTNSAQMEIDPSLLLMDLEDNSDEAGPMEEEAPYEFA